MTTAGQRITWLRDTIGRWEAFLLFVLVMTFICGAQVSQYFLRSSNISIALAGMTPAAIVALPMTLIIVTGEIDISVGSVVGLCATFMAVCLEHGLPVQAAMLLGIIAGTLAGLLNGIIVVYGGLPSLVVTIGTLALYRGIAQIILKERGVSGFPEWYQILDSEQLAPRRSHGVQSSLCCSLLGSRSFCTRPIGAAHCTQSATTVRPPGSLGLM